MGIIPYEEILKLCREIGFDDCGIADPDLPHIVHEHFQQWIKEGHIGTLAYLKRRLSLSHTPSEIFPGVRSVIITILNYNTPFRTVNPSFQEPKIQGFITYYARFRDYHQIFHHLHHRLILTLEKRFGVQSKGFADTTPFSEKSYAICAGLGLLGRNTLLYHPRFGSYVFLGCVFTHLMIERTFPQTRESGTFLHPFCQHCCQCQKICPTNAILSDSIGINCQRCINALTIENRSGIPISLRSSIGTHFFGCDRCQSECPINKKLPSFPPSVFGEPLLPPAIDLLQFLVQGKTRKEQKKIFMDTPVLRANRWGLIRNAIICAVNQQAKDIIPFCQKLMQSTDCPLWLKETCVWAVQQLTE